MPIHYVTGDILTNEYHAKAFAIASNCEGEMNLQSTVPFRERFPDMFFNFQRRCLDEESALNIGDVYLYVTRDDVPIFNLALYRNRFLVMAGQRTVEDAFRQLRLLAEEAGIISIAMPALGAGTGYIDWTRAKRSLERTFKDWEGDIYVYVKGSVREDMRHWDEADDIDEDAPVRIPRGWKPAMTLYTPEARRAEKQKRERERKNTQEDADNKGGGRKRSGRNRNRRGNRGGSGRGRKRNNAPRQE